MEHHHQINSFFMLVWLSPDLNLFYLSRQPPFFYITKYPCFTHLSLRYNLRTLAEEWTEYASLLTACVAPASFVSNPFCEEDTGWCIRHVVSRLCGGNCHRVSFLSDRQLSLETGYNWANAGDDHFYRQLQGRRFVANWDNYVIRLDLSIASTLPMLNWGMYRVISKCKKHEAISSRQMKMIHVIYFSSIKLHHFEDCLTRGHLFLYYYYISKGSSILTI